VHWPPSAEIDNRPYAVSINDKVIKMISSKDPKIGFVVTKEFSGNKKDGFYSLKYIITNKSDSTQKAALWEVTRVRANGIAFFPMGEGRLRGELASLTIKKDGIVWFAYKKMRSDTFQTIGTLYADGAEGWVAEVNKKTILVK
jgi:hypothetical protein